MPKDGKETTGTITNYKQYSVDQITIKEGTHGTLENFPRSTV